MSTELDRALEALRARADTALLPPSDALRARGDYRRRLTVAATVAGVAVVALGAALGASILRPTAINPPVGTPTITATPSPTVEPTPSVEPTTPAPDPTGSPIHLPAGCGDDPTVLPGSGPMVAGDALPTSMMLTGANLGRCWALYQDVGGYLLRDPSRSVEPPPFVCHLAGAYSADEQRVAGRFRTFLGGPEVGAHQAVTRYQPGRAAPFMDEVRAAVQACATFETQYDPVPQYARIVETGFAGDESLMIYTGGTPTPTAETYPSTYIAVVRVGDLVTVVESSSDLAGIPSLTRTMAQRAAAKL